MYEQLKSAIGAVMFFLVYLLASIGTATISFTVAVVMYTGKRLNIEICHELYRDFIEISRESFDRSLNHILVVLPDKVRQSLGYEMECW